MRLNVRAQFPNAVPGNYVVLNVGDTGTGIKPDVLARLFEPYTSTKAPFSILNQRVTWKQAGCMGVGAHTELDDVEVRQLSVHESEVLADVGRVLFRRGLRRLRAAVRLGHLRVAAT